MVKLMDEQKDEFNVQLRKTITEEQEKSKV